MSMQKKSLAILLALAAASAALAQDGRPVAFVNARIVPITGDVIERGTLVVKNGKIEALGADVATPPGARIVDASGKTILPGLVSAVSRAGLAAPPPRQDDGGGGGRRRGGMPMPMPGGGGGGTQNRPTAKVTDGLYAKQTVFAELLRQGVTTLALNPVGGAFPGLGALLRPDGKSVAELVADDDAFVQVTMVRDGGTKKLLKDNFDKAKKVVEDRKKPPEKPPAPAAAPAEAKPGDKPADKPPEAKEPPKGGEPPKPEPKPEPPKPEPKPDQPPQGQGGQQPAPQQKPPEPPKDPNIELLADLLEGKQRAIVQIDSAADLLHWQTVVADDVKFPRAVAVLRHDPLSGTVDRVIEPLKAWQCPVLLPLDLATLPRSRYLIHPAKQLHDAGIEIGFVLGDSPQTMRFTFYRVMELVRHGLPADVALRALTLVPAKALGVDKKVGTLDVGKNADLLVFQGDPLAPTGQLDSVWLGGKEVPLQP